MNDMIVILSQALRNIVVLMETILNYVFLTTTKTDVESKIEKLNEDRQEIMLRHSLIQKVIKFRKRGFIIEQMDFINDNTISKNELKAMHDNFDALDSLLNAQQEKVDKNKNATIANLYLLNEKKKLLNAKIISVLIMVTSAISIIFLSIPFWSVSIGLITYVIYELKDQAISYRVNKGYFGTTTSEAIDLIKFIRENIDEIDSGDGGGAKRKILNPIKQSTNEDAKSNGELPNV